MSPLWMLAVQPATSVLGSALLLALLRIPSPSRSPAPAQEGA